MEKHVEERKLMTPEERWNKPKETMIVEAEEVVRY